MDVILIAMPWAGITYPSIQLGILKSLLDRSRVPCTPMSLNLSFFEYLAARGQADRLSLEQYDYIGEASGLGLGEWIFASAAKDHVDAARDDAYRDFVTQCKPEHGVLEKAERARRLVPGFLDQCAEKILAAQPRVVGFTSTFSQTFPSLALAKRLKKQAPGLRIVFGGANCDGSMGKTLHELYPWIDVVVRGESERIAPRLFRELAAGDTISRQPGLCIREDGEITAVVEPERGGVNMEESPLPNYDEYFSRLPESPVSDEVGAGGITYESARGCWWGAKHHCTFCGLNGTTMNFRSKPAARVFEELHTLARRYKNLHFIVVDNIIDMNHVKELLPMLRAGDIDFSFYYETKVNLKKQEMRLLHDVGVRMIQPGIESLSTPILKLMRKGTTALQNVRFLKWCAELGISPDWNLLYGFPGEQPEEYDRMADVMASLMHLTPPCSVHPICINRFSPYHQDPEKFGIRIQGPKPWYRFLHEADEKSLNDLAYFFEHDYDDGREPEQYVEPVRRAVAAWKQDADQNYRKLTVKRGPGFVQVTDGRSNGKGGTYTLDGVAGEAYLACERGATPHRVWHTLSPEYQSGVSENDVKDFLDQMVSMRLVFEEAGHYLSLALPAGEPVDVADRPGGGSQEQVRPAPASLFPATVV
jgi:ribosomal peptide maturation radical SAM protein 1